jgi:hypothetical protein
MPASPGAHTGLPLQDFREAESPQAVLPLKIRRLPGYSVAGQIVVGLTLASVFC